MSGLLAAGLAVAAAVGGEAPAEGLDSVWLSSDDTLWLTAGAGTTLNRSPQPRVALGLRWNPFPAEAWGGLANVGASFEVVSRPNERGDVGAMIGAVYGKPRPGFWLAFDAGFSVLVGWGPPTGSDILLTPAASARLGFGPVSLRVLGLISGGRRVLRRQNYAVTLEILWGFAAKPGEQVDDPIDERPPH